MNYELKSQLVEQVKEKVKETYPEIRPYCSCLYNSYVMIKTLKGKGIDAIVQAGSMSWPIINLDEDDGIQDTHFSYIWQPNDYLSKIAMLNGNLPEIHIWVGIIDTNELIDISTSGFKTAAKMFGLEWTAPDPPDFLWCEMSKLPRGVIYNPNLAACKFAHNAISVI